MKQEFIGFYMPAEDELKAAWDSDKTLFVFDANVLLKLYSYQQNTLDDFFAILQKLKDRIWIPHQVGLEFQNKRLEIKRTEKEKFSNIENDIKQLLKIESSIEQKFLKGRFPKLDTATKELFDKIRLLVDDYKIILKDCNESQPSIRAHDTIREKIDCCFEAKVGGAFSHEELQEIYAEGENRYANKIPPGFIDNRKGENKDYFYKGIEYKRKFGDLILWKQIIEKAKDENITNVIFITDDEKDDWWYITKEGGDKVIGPLANLTHEIIEKAKISLFHMYNTNAFFEAAKKFASIEIQENSIVETMKVHETEMLENKKQEELENFHVLDLFPDTNNSLMEQKVRSVTEKLDTVAKINEFIKAQQRVREMTEKLDTLGTAAQINKFIEAQQKAREITEKLDTLDAAAQINKFIEAQQKAREMTEKLDTLDTAAQINKFIEAQQKARKMTEKLDTLTRYFRHDSKNQ